MGDNAVWVILTTTRSNGLERAFKPMTRYRKRKDAGIVALAFRSRWQFSASIAAASVFAASVALPALLGHSALLRPLASLFVPLAWLSALLFTGVALIRIFQTRDARERAPGTALAEAAQRRLPEGRDAPAGTISPPHPDAWSPELLGRIEWKRFEDLCCAFYRQKGIRAETTPLGPDGGVDIRLYQDDREPNRATAIVQCKAWNQDVGVKPVRELRGVMAHEKIDKAFFMAPKGFTPEARSFAKENGITLLDGKLFVVMLQRLPAEASRHLLEFSTTGDWTTPTYPGCGAPMTARAGRRGPFWGCVTYPRCRAILSMRGESAAGSDAAANRPGQSGT